MNTKKDRNLIVTKRAHALLVVLGGGAGLAIAMQGLVSFAIPTRAEMVEQGIQEIHSAPVRISFANLSLEAHAVYVEDIKTGIILFAKNEDEKLPLASVTKIMTAFVARDRMPESATFTLTKDDLLAEGDTGLLVGERWRLGDIMNVMLLISSNDAAHGIAGFVGADSNDGSNNEGISRTHFVQMMNEKAQMLKLDHMQFFNESGLDVDEAQNGGYGSARNVAKLFAELWEKYPETVEVTAHKDARIYSQDEVAHIIPNTNEIVGNIPGLIASKTGYTEISGGNLAVIFDRGIGDPVVAVVLGSSYKGRFEDRKKLVAAAREFPLNPNK